MRLILFLLLCICAFAQQQAASVTGRVVNASTGSPVSGVRLYFDRQSNPPAYFLAETDSNGVFSAVGLDPGVYKLTAERSGFTSLALRGTVTLRPGQHLSNIDFRLEAEGVLAGRVLDDDGDPVSNGALTVMRRGYVEGVATLRPVTAANIVLLTDDRGEFRIFGLRPGTYYLRAGQPAAELARSPSANTYFPNAASPADARAIEVTSGGVIGNIEIRLAKTLTTSVSGRIDNRTGFSAQAGASLLAADGARYTAITRREGDFAVGNVPPGTYAFLATMSVPNGGYFFHTHEVVVGAQPIEGLNAALLPASKLNGKVLTDGGGIDLKSIEVRFDIHGLPQPLPQGTVAARPTSDGTLQIPRISRGVYDFSLTGLPKGVYVKSVRIGGFDLLTDSLAIEAEEVGPLEIVLAKGAPSLSGTTDPGAKVVLVPDGTARRARKAFYGVAQAGQDGSFSLEGLMPGTYKVFAWAEVEDTAWRNAEFLKNYEDEAVPILLETDSETRVEVHARQ